MQLLLEQMGAGPTGTTTVIISDVREELVLYVNGTPYLRRELEMPAAALHHAGIHATQVRQRRGSAPPLSVDVTSDVGRQTGRAQWCLRVHKPESSGPKSNQIKSIKHLHPHPHWNARPDLKCRVSLKICPWCHCCVNLLGGRPSEGQTQGVGATAEQWARATMLSVCVLQQEPQRTAHRAVRAQRVRSWRSS